MSKENEIEFNKKLLITKDALPAILGQVGSTREKARTTEILIPFLRIVREYAEKFGDKTSVLLLLQEESLSGQHMIMGEKGKKFKTNLLRAANGLYLMVQAEKAMWSYLKINKTEIDPAAAANIYRFAGRTADHKGQYRKSEKYYRKGLMYFEGVTKIEKRIRILELRGFLSYSWLKQGKRADGMKMAEETLKDFDESEEGIWLKEHKETYYTWAVWKSGVEMRTAEYILKKRDVKNYQTAREYLADAEKILVMPDGNTKKFEIRRNELDIVKKMLRH
jgi:tetratricopeptide (TPR) repeat protein